MLDEAKQAGVIFYSPPDRLQSSQIDPLILPIVELINQSGWCWTAESCSGHPDLDVSSSWHQSTDPMLRLVCKVNSYGKMLSYLLDAATKYEQIRLLIQPRQVGDGKTDWREIIVSIPSRNVYERNLGLEVFSLFSQNLH